MKKIMVLALIAMLSVLASCGGDDSQKSAEDTMKQAQEEAMKNMTPEQKEQAEAAMKAAEEAMKNMTPEQKAAYEAAQKQAADANNAAQ